MAMVPHERSLVERLQGKPFALLGVNVDPSPEALARAQNAHGITWRSWWDSGRRIASKYRVGSYPSLFLVNHDGIIRQTYRGKPRDADLESDVMRVIAEAEADTKRRAAGESRTPAGNGL
jgi:hypothetical protein